MSHILDDALFILFSVKVTGICHLVLFWDLFRSSDHLNGKVESHIRINTHNPYPSIPVKIHKVNLIFSVILSFVRLNANALFIKYNAYVIRL